MSNLLDNDYANFIDLKEENILWQGKPTSSFFPDLKKYSILEKVRYSILFIPLVLYILAPVYIIYRIIGHSIVLALIAIIYVLIYSLHHIYQHKRKQKIAYYIIKTGIYFQLPDWKKEQTDFIPFDNIERINILPTKTGEGDLIIYPKEAVSFVTYDFKKREPQAFPTLIKIEEVKEVAALVQQKIKP